MEYDAWGARRNPGGTPASSGTAFALQPGHREFTGHETIPGLGLVNMNGRVYDPSLGRFLSPDSHVQFSDDLQSYNRYSYALNNPLRYTDPTGYWITGSKFGDSLVSFGLGMLAVAMCPATGGGTCMAAFAIAQAYWGIMSAVTNDATFSQIVETTAVNFVSSQIGGAAGGLLGGVGGAMVSGAVSGAINQVYADHRSGRDPGWDVLRAAAEGAHRSALVWGASSTVAQVSHADAARAEGTGASAEEIARQRAIGQASGAAASRALGGMSVNDELDLWIAAGLATYDANRAGADAGGGEWMLAGGGQSLNPAEREWIAMHPLAALSFRRAAAEARAEAELLFPKELTNGRGDAFRHAYWNALMARAEGAQLAAEFANRHELWDDANTTVAERTMDIHNNSIGRQLGSSPDGSHTLVYRVLDAMAKQRLWWIDKNGGLVTHQ
jgi:RHS repeat-associated protein